MNFNSMIYVHIDERGTVEKVITSGIKAPTLVIVGDEKYSRFVDEEKITIEMEHENDRADVYIRRMLGIKRDKFFTLLKEKLPKIFTS